MAAVVIRENFCPLELVCHLIICLHGLVCSPIAPTTVTRLLSLFLNESVKALTLFTIISLDSASDCSLEPVVLSVGTLSVSTVLAWLYLTGDYSLFLKHKTYPLE